MLKIYLKHPPKPDGTPTTIMVTELLTLVKKRHDIRPSPRKRHALVAYHWIRSPGARMIEGEELFVPRPALQKQLKTPIGATGGERGLK